MGGVGCSSIKLYLLFIHRIAAIHSRVLVYIVLATTLKNASQNLLVVKIETLPMVDRLVCAHALVVVVDFSRSLKAKKQIDCCPFYDDRLIVVFVFSFVWSRRRLRVWRIPVCLYEPDLSKVQTVIFLLPIVRKNQQSDLPITTKRSRSG